MTALMEQIDAAFHFRGQVTVSLNSGEQVVGYLYNRELSNSKPHVELFLEGSGQPVNYPISELKTVELSGRDHAQE